jgi:hypothetical protein
MEIFQISREIRIKVYHVDAHQNKDDLQTKYDNEADRLASVVIKLKHIIKVNKQGSHNLKLRGNGPQ